MASVQYYQALRISEAAGLFFEDVKLNFQSPADSSIRVCRHVLFPRMKNAVPEVAQGFKNASGGDRSVKELYLYPQAFEALKQVWAPGKKGPCLLSRWTDPLLLPADSVSVRSCFRSGRPPLSRNPRFKAWRMQTGLQLHGRRPCFGSTAPWQHRSWEHSCLRSARQRGSEEARSGGMEPG